MKKSFVTRLIVVCLISALTLSLAACGSNTAKPDTAKGGKTYVTIAGAASSGTWFLLANTMAAVLNTEYGKEGWVASAQSTSGTGENIRLLESGDVNFIFVQGGTCADAYNGGITWKGKPATFLRTIGYCYPVYIQLVVRKNSGITRVEDLAGKKVAVGVAGSSTEINSNQVCAAAGLEYSKSKVLIPEYVMESEAADMLKNGRVDAAFVPAPIGSATMKDLMSTGQFTLVDISTKIADKMKKDYNAAYYASVIPAGSYEGLNKDVASVSYAIYMMTSEKVNQDLVYKFTKTIYEKNARLAETYSGIKQMQPEKAKVGAPAPLAPGAERYFKEIGALK